MVRRFALLPLACVCCLAHAGFTAQEVKGLSDALFLKNLTLQDLNTPGRSWPLSLPFVDACRQKPLQGTERFMDLNEQALKDSPAKLLATARKTFLGDPQEMRQPLPPAALPLIPAGAPASLRTAIADLAIALHQANAYCARATSGLNPAEKEELVDSLPALASGDPERRFPGILTQPLERSKTLERLAKVDLPLLRRVAEVLLEQTQSAIPRLRDGARERWNGSIDFDCQGQRVVVSGRSNVRWDLPANVLLIDFGSHNTYAGHEGAGIAGASLLISFGENNAYEQGDIGAGTGLLGIGIAFDFGGSNFKGGSFAFGCGIGGVGVLRENGDSATFTADEFCEGFGEFGIGFLSGGGGKPEYRASSFAQGCARTQGVGWLVSKRADALFSLTGSFGQGASLGYDDGSGEMAGGLGLLSKSSGRDTFLGGSLCQGSAESNGLGALFSREGDDIFIADDRAQAFARADGAALLMHLKGSSSLVIKNPRDTVYDPESLALSLIRGGGAAPADNDWPGVSLSAAVPESDSSLLTLTDSGLRLRIQATPRGSQQVARLANPDLDQAHAVAAGFAEKLRPGSAPVPPGNFLEHCFESAANEAAPPDVRAQALAQLANYGYPGFGRLLQTKLAQCGRGGRDTIAALADSLGDTARKALALKITDADDRTALSALTICVENRFEECAPLVLGAMSRPALASEAARAAGIFRIRETVGTLMLLSGQLDRTTALASAQALTQIADPQSLSTAEALLGSNDRRMREAAIQLLAVLPGGFEVAKELSRDLDEQVARKGIRVLSLIGTEPALDVIGGALLDMRSGVRIEALLALQGRVPEKFRTRFEALKNDPAPLVQAVLAGLSAG